MRHPPRFAESVFIADSARVVGNVQIGEDSSVWFGTIIRGDVEPIVIGSRTNVQDLSMVHVTGGKGPALIGDGVTIGHRAVVHGCKIHDNCLIGIGAIVLDGAEIGPDSVIAAGAVVTPGTRVPPKTMFLGIPARLARALTDKEVDANRKSALGYVSLKAEYLGKKR